MYLISLSKLETVLKYMQGTINYKECQADLKTKQNLKFQEMITILKLKTLWRGLIRYKEYIGGG